jgi:hypothetical protein
MGLISCTEEPEPIPQTGNIYVVNEDQTISGNPIEGYDVLLYDYSLINYNGFPSSNWAILENEFLQDGTVRFNNVNYGNYFIVLQSNRGSLSARVAVQVKRGETTTVETNW